MTRLPGFSRSMLLIAIVAATAMLLGSSAARAQDAATPAAGDTMMTHDHPIHIHSGTCDALGDVVFPLENLTSEGAMATPMAEDMDEATAESGDEDMSDHHDVVAASTTTVTVTFDDLTGSEHAINVHESADNIGNYIACGDISADNISDDTLNVDLNELNDSGYEGMAVIKDNGDGTVDVSVKIWHVEMMGTPEASPTS